VIEPGRQLQICPRCGLTLKPRLPSLAVEHCPRCVARNRRAIKLFPAGLGRPPAENRAQRPS
jgi:predicted amidophosphoribosyltransferase